MSLFFLNSCAYLEKVRRPIKATRSKQSSNKSSNSSGEYLLKDKSGEFLVKREKGSGKKGKIFIVKQKVFPFNNSNGDAVEKSVSISEVGILNGKVKILRPQKSQYVVWFDKKRFSSNIEIDPASKSLKLEMQSPEKEWNGTKIIPFPNTSSVYCFFSQIIDCAKTSDFIEKATSRETGKMNFYVIWDAYPYFQQQYDNLSSNIFSQAELEFDGKTSGNLVRFNLKVEGQSIFYVIDSESNLKGQYWVSQGLTFERRN